MNDEDPRLAKQLADAFEQMVDAQEKEAAKWKKLRERTDFTDEFRPFMDGAAIDLLSVKCNWDGMGNAHFYFRANIKEQHYQTAYTISRFLMTDLREYASARHRMYHYAAYELYRLLRG